MSYIYLDNAATTFPKPRRVLDEVNRCIRTYCGNSGRSAHPLAIASSEKIFECRQLLSDFFSFDKPENVVFTSNTTYALNMAIKGVTRRGDHILISDMEHNSVFRPVALLAKAGLIEYDIFPTLKNGKQLSAEEICRSIISLIRPGKTRVLICSHIPNIVSTVRPIELIGDICRRNGLIFILDAAQSAGHIPIDIKASKIDILCAPGHKALFGIQGCGFMILGDECPSLSTLIEGGNGFNSLETSLPEDSPERFESGTLPTPSIAGLCEGIKFINEIGYDDIRKRENILFNRLANALTSKSIGAEIYVSDAPGSVLLFNIPDRSPDELGSYLSKQNICLRSGFHCAALGHKLLKTDESGALRASFSVFNSPNDIDALYKAIVDFKKT